MQIEIHVSNSIIVYVLFQNLNTKFVTYTSMRDYNVKNIYE